MAISSVKSIYQEVFENVRHDIQNEQTITLYKVIKIILQYEEPETYEKFINICSDLEIVRDGSKDEDISSSLEDIVLSKHLIAQIPGVDFARKTSKDISSKVNELSGHNKVENLKWLVFTACAIVGVYFCAQYLNNKKNGRERSKYRERVPSSNPSSNSISTRPRKICAVLYLVVPEYALGQMPMASALSPNQVLSADQIIQLIDKASYFLCKEYGSQKIQLNTNSDRVLMDANSKMEVYIRLRIENGEHLIDESVPYILKRDLRPDQQATIEEVAYLESLSGLESFNCI